MQVGQQVRIGTGGVSVFEIVSVDADAGAAIVRAVADTPGSYPWPTLLASLVPVEE